MEDRARRTAATLCVIDGRVTVCFESVDSLIVIYLFFIFTVAILESSILRVAFALVMDKYNACFENHLLILHL